MTLNPLNTDARVNALVAQLNAVPPRAAPAELEREARDIVRLAPADARGYSLLGGALERAGDIDGGRALYQEALTHSKTERFALLRLLTLALSDKQESAAVRYFDLLLRRWREYWDDIIPVAFQFLHEPSAESAFRSALSVDPPWRDRVVSTLLQRADGALFVRDTLQEEVQHGRRNDSEIAIAIDGLIKQKAYTEAYLLFSRTMTAEDREVAGYVHDAGFARAPGRRAFEWRVKPNSSVDLQYPAVEASAGLSVRFLQMPAKLGTIQQTLFLPPDNYRLSVTATAHNLTLPKALYWQVRCAGTATEIGRVDIGEGTYGPSTFEGTFQVPAASCPLVDLVLRTDVESMMRRNSYSGDVLLSDVSVRRNGSVVD